MFKNMQIYRSPAPWSISRNALETALSVHSFAPCASMDLQCQGWSTPRNDGALVYAVAGQWLLHLKTEKKVLPAAVIKKSVKVRAAEIESERGFAPGKMQLREIKEQITDALLSKAFTVESITQVWIDPINGWLVIDSASQNRADDVIKHLMRAVDHMPLEMLRVQRSPVAVMTEWLYEHDSPIGFSIDDGGELRATGESRSMVRYVKHTLEAADMQRHIAAGKQCTRLAMTWNQRISFVLTETLMIKSVKMLDVLTESMTGNADERFDGDFALMTGEMNKMMVDLIEALGGEVAMLKEAA